MHALVLNLCVVLDNKCCVLHTVAMPNGLRWVLHVISCAFTFFFFFWEFMCFYLWASTPAPGNLCKIQKATTFTHFTSKIFHISPSKVVQIYTFATVIMHICMVTVARHGYCSSCIPYFINFIFCAFFFSLLYAKQTDFSPQSSSSFSSDTHKHKHTHTQTQTHREIITEGASSWSRV